MKLPLQISFHNVERSPQIEGLIEEQAERLDAFFGRIMSCRVVVDLPHQHHREGNLFQVRIDLKVPGEEIAVSRESGKHDAATSLEATIGEAFDTALRQLEDYVRRQRGDVKTHAEPLQARVTRVFPEAGYGFLAAQDGHEVYFHENAVREARLGELQVGDEVSFAEVTGDKGPQASVVRPTGRRRE